MLNDEEREALERIDYIQDFIIENGQYNADVNDMEYFSKVLNLIEKQSKEIEEVKNADLTTVYLNGFYDGEKKVEDKIKAKIEEWQKEKEFYDKDEDREWGQYNNWDWVDTIINEMQSLLEKE